MLGPLRLPVAALVATLLASCYTWEPVRGVDPQVGSRIAFDINDAGRTALGGTMGPEIAQVAGQLIERDTGSYLLAVSTVRLLHGAEQPWSGEQVRLRHDYLGPVYERQFSKGRSIGLGVVGIGGLTALFVTRSLLGSGSDSSDQPPDTVNTRLGRP